MRKLIFLILFLSSTAFAQEMPKRSPLDSRIQKVDYNENDVVEIHATRGVATHIVFEEAEEILDIATGFGDGWEIVKKRNNLYIKPKPSKSKDESKKAVNVQPFAEGWNTNIVVTTNLRVYAFELMLEEKVEGKLSKMLKNESARTAYRITFKYPLSEHYKKLEVLRGKVIEKQLEKTPSPLNDQYSMKVRKDSLGIAPIKAWDDGRFTYLTFAGNQEFPAVFLAEGKKESLINTHIDPKHPDVLVIQRIASSFILRSGSKVVGIFNERQNIYGPANHTGTTVPGIMRVLKSERKSKKGGRS